MSKRPKKSRHRIPSNLPMRSDIITDRYQVEIDRSTTRLERHWRRAKKALVAAEAKHARAAGAARVRELGKLVAMRRDELQKIEILMRPPNTRDSQRRLVRQESGEITIPLGGTARRWNSTKYK